MTATEPTFLSAILAWLFAFVPHVLAALAFIIAGVWLSRVCERMVHRLMDSRLSVEPTLRGVLGSGVRYLMLGYVCWPRSASSASRRVAYWRFWPPLALP
jgi:hypothetical protein